MCEAFKHYKPVAATGAGASFLELAGVTGATPHPKAGPDADPSAGVVVGKDADVARSPATSSPRLRRAASGRAA